MGVLALGNPAGLQDAEFACKEKLAAQLAPLRNHCDSCVSEAAKEALEQIRLVPGIGPIIESEATALCPSLASGSASPQPELDGKWRLLKTHSTNMDLGAYLAIQFPSVVGGPSQP